MHAKSIGWLFGFFFTLVIIASATAFGRESRENTGTIAVKLIAGTHAEQEAARLLNPGKDLSTAVIRVDCAEGFRYSRMIPTAEMKDDAQQEPHHLGYHYADIPPRKVLTRITPPGRASGTLIGVSLQMIRRANQLQ